MSKDCCKKGECKTEFCKAANDDKASPNECCKPKADDAKPQPPKGGRCTR